MIAPWIWLALASYRCCIQRLTTQIHWESPALGRDPVGIIVSAVLVCFEYYVSGGHHRSTAFRFTNTQRLLSLLPAHDVVVEVLVLWIRGILLSHGRAEVPLKHRISESLSRRVVISHLDVCSYTVCLSPPIRWTSPSSLASLHLWKLRKE